jgi:hypothetical protein
LNLLPERVRVYTYRLVKEGKLREIDRIGNTRLFELIDARHPSPSTNASADTEFKDHLAFLNSFFKQNVAYLSKNAEIKKFLEDNGDRFARIEKILGEGAEKHA